MPTQTGGAAAGGGSGSDCSSDSDSDTECRTLDRGRRLLAIAPDAKHLHVNLGSALIKHTAVPLPTGPPCEPCLVYRVCVSVTDHGFTLREWTYPPGNVNPGLVGGVSSPEDLPPTLADFETLFPAADAQVSQVAEIDEPASEDGSHFVMHWSGKFAVTTAGSYDFVLASDDGSLLFINGVLAADNNGAHALETVTATVPLTAGLHDINVLFYERSGQDQLTLRYSGPDTGGSPEPVPPAGGVSVPYGTYTEVDSAVTDASSYCFKVSNKWTRQEGARIHIMDSFRPLSTLRDADGCTIRPPRDTQTRPNVVLACPAGERRRTVLFSVEDQLEYILCKGRCIKADVVPEDEGPPDPTPMPGKWIDCPSGWTFCPSPCAHLASDQINGDRAAALLRAAVHRAVRVCLVEDGKGEGKLLCTPPSRGWLANVQTGVSIPELLLRAYAFKAGKTWGRHGLSIQEGDAVLLTFLVKDCNPCSKWFGTVKPTPPNQGDERDGCLCIAVEIVFGTRD